MIRGGLSAGCIPGIIFANGVTWAENRRTSLHILKNFGFGKNVMEEMIDDEVNKLLQHIDDQWIDIPLDVSRFFNITALGSLWRLIPPNHVLVEPQYYHGDGSKITLIPWLW